MAPTPAIDINLCTVHSWLKRNETPTSTGAKIVSYTNDLGDDGPVLWLVHGYPQSAFIWRHVAAVLKDKVSLYIPELPGYGISTSPQDFARRTVGNALLEASHTLFPNRPVILGGHDRGARTVHRLAVDHDHPPSGSQQPKYELLGTVLLDIVPTLLQWRAFANPTASVAYFHWPFLASPLSADMIEAYGGDKWCHTALDRIGGDNSKAKAAFQSDSAWEHYTALFSRRDTIEGSCADYAAASQDEPKLQEEDQRSGRKMEKPVLIRWSLGKLGKMHGDLEEIWKDWIREGTLLDASGVGNDVGHYLPEEAADEISEAIETFIRNVRK